MSDVRADFVLSLSRGAQWMYSLISMVYRPACTEQRPSPHRSQPLQLHVWWNIIIPLSLSGYRILPFVCMISCWFLIMEVRTELPFQAFVTPTFTSVQ